MKKSFADILSEQLRDTETRMAKKVPEWSEYGLEYPTRLSTEQCSSSATARYKSMLMQRIARTEGSSVQKRGGTQGIGVIRESAEGSEEARPRIADITGGLGVDSWAFAGMSETVLHNEMNAALSDTVRKNFRNMGITNVVHSSICISEDTVDDALGWFRPDIIFADPSRREAGSGKRVFLLQDCTPDILNLKDKLLQISPDVVVKLSPMADISLICKQLGENVREVHVLGSGGPSGECKELLVWMRRDWSGGCRIVIADAESVLEGISGKRTERKEAADKEHRVHGAYGELLEHEKEAADEERRTGALAFKTYEEERADVALAATLQRGDFLIEPSAALMKGGCFALLCERFQLRKLGVSTHLYTGQGFPAALHALCKCFRIVEVLPLNGGSMRDCGRRYPHTEVTARNIPMSSEQLRTRMKISPGRTDTHIFGCRIDALGNSLVVTERVG